MSFKINYQKPRQGGVFGLFDKRDILLYNITIEQSMHNKKEVMEVATDCQATHHFEGRSSSGGTESANVGLDKRIKVLRKAIDSMEKRLKGMDIAALVEMKRECDHLERQLYRPPIRHQRRNAQRRK